MSWWAIEVTPGAMDPDLVAGTLARLSGHAAHQRSDGVIVGGADGEAPARAIAVELDRELPGLPVPRLLPAPVVDWRERWRDGISVWNVGRLRVGPSWLLEPGPDAVVVDPETAFGTGEHGSTRGALALLDRHVRRGDTVIDCGSGSGILAIAAARLGASRAIAVDLDPEAEAIAVGNAARNGVAGAVTVLTGDARVMLPLIGPANLIVSNILRGPNTALLPLVRAALAPGGVAMFAGMEQAERSLFLRSVEQAGLVAGDEVTDDGWWSLAARAG